MLDRFQVRDLPLLDVVIALESAALKAVVAALEHGECRAVLVLDLAGLPRGLVMREAVLRHASRLSDLRVGLLPAMGIVEVKPNDMLHEAAQAVSNAGAGALFCRCGEGSDLQVMLRDEMLNLTDWSPLVAAKAEREAASARHALLASPNIVESPPAPPAPSPATMATRRVPPVIEV
jgi:hypothetical protein